MFMLIPKNDAGVPLLKGEKLFDHICRFRNVQHAATKGRGENKAKITLFEPRGGLSVHLYSNLLKNIQPTANQLRRGAIIKDCIRNNAARKNAQHKLNSYGYLVGHCNIVKNIKNMERMKEQLIMADSVAEIHRNKRIRRTMRKRQRL